MGAPRRIRKKYEKPRAIWNAQRIESDNSLINKYGLKNMRELWKVQTEVSRIRGNARRLLASSGGVENTYQKEALDIIERLKRAGIVKDGATLDSLLDINVENILERRLESLVFRKGMALSMRQARQLIVHGFISVDTKKVTKPSYIIRTTEESKLGYYRPIEILQKSTKDVPIASPSIEDSKSEIENS